LTRKFGSIEAGNEAKIDRIGADREYDRNGCGCRLCRQRSGRGGRNDDCRQIGHQFGGKCRQAVEATIGRAIFDRDVVAFDIAGFLESLPNSANLSIIELTAAQQADQRHRRLLRARRERPGDRCRAAERG